MRPWSGFGSPPLDPRLTAVARVTSWLDVGAEFAKLCQKITKICQESAKNQLANDCIYAPSSHTPAQSCQRGPTPSGPTKRETHSHRFVDNVTALFCWTVAQGAWHALRPSPTESSATDADLSHWTITKRNTIWGHMSAATDTDFSPSTTIKWNTERGTLAVRSECSV